MLSVFTKILKHIFICKSQDMYITETKPAPWNMLERKCSGCGLTWVDSTKEV